MAIKNRSPFFRVPRNGFEPSHPCGRCDLNTVRLPISPPGQLAFECLEFNCPNVNRHSNLLNNLTFNFQISANIIACYSITKFQYLYIPYYLFLSLNEYFLVFSKINDMRLFMPIGFLIVFIVWLLYRVLIKKDIKQHLNTVYISFVFFGIWTMIYFLWIK